MRTRQKTIKKFEGYDLSPVPITAEDHNLSTLVYNLFFYELPKTFSFADRLEYVRVRTGLSFPALQKITLENNYRDAFNSDGSLLKDFEVTLAEKKEAKKNAMKALGLISFDEAKPPSAQEVVDDMRKFVGGAIKYNASMLQFGNYIVRSLIEMQYKRILSAGGIDALYNDPRNIGLKHLFDQTMVEIRELNNDLKSFTSTSTIPTFAKVLSLDTAADALGEDVEKGALTVEEIHRVAEELKMTGAANNDIKLLKQIQNEILEDNGLPVLDASATSIAKQKATKNIEHDGLE